MKKAAQLTTFLSGIVSWSSIISAFVAVVIGYSKIGTFPLTPDDFSLHGYLQQGTLNWIEVFFLQGVYHSISIGFLFVMVLLPINLILFFYLKTQKIDRGKQLSVSISMAGVVILFLLAFQFRLGLEEFFYCFVCWYFE